jgi:hypothetical protein
MCHIYRRDKTICKAEKYVCLDPCLGYTERYLCVALEMCRIDVLVLVLVLLWCWKLRVALARSCIVTGDHCRIGVPSVVVIDSACGTDTVLCCMWESLFN